MFIVINYFAKIKVLKRNSQVSTMSDQTFRRIRLLCQDTMDPDRSAKAMQDLLNSNIKLVKRVSTVNFLKRMIRLGIGTNDVESMYSSLQKPLVRKTEDRRIVSLAMRLKLSGGECCVKQARQEFFNHKNIYHSVVKRNSYIDNDFKDLMDRECGVVWKARKEDNRKKTDWLLQKWRNKNDDAESNIRGVKYRDVDLNGSESDKNPEPVTYGGVEVTDSMAEVLTMNPNMMMYEKLDPVKMEIEIEKSFFKAR